MFDKSKQMFAPLLAYVATKNPLTPVNFFAGKWGGRGRVGHYTRVGYTNHMAFFAYKRGGKTLTYTGSAFTEVTDVYPWAKLIFQI